MTRRLTLRQLFTHSTVTLVQQGLGTLCALGTNILIARMLGPSGQGMYGLVVATAVIVCMVSGLGIPAASIYFVGSRQTPMATAAQQNILLATLLGAAGAALLALTAPWVLPGVPCTVVLLGGALAALLLLNNLMTAVLQGAQSFHAYNVFALMPPLLTLVFLATGALLGATHLHNALMATVAAQGCTALATLGMVAPAGLARPWRIDRGYVRHALRYGGVATVANIIGQLNYRTDVYLIAHWLGTGAVGHYAVATGVGERLWILSFASSVVLLPHAARTQADGAPSLTPVVARHVLLLSLLAGAGLYVLAPWALPIIFGADYHASVPALRALLPGLVALNVGRLLSNDLAGRGRPDLNAWLGGAALLINVGANVYCIPRWGIVGAGLATSISYSCDALSKLVAFSRVAGVPWYESVLLQRTDLQRLRAARDLA